MKRLLSILLIVLLTVSMAPATGIMVLLDTSGIAYAGDAIPIDEAHFPDKSFRDCLQEKYGDSVDPSSVKELSIYAAGSLEGVEQFTALEILHCGGLNLSSLDVSNLKSLKELDCSRNKLTALDVSENTELEKLICYENPLSALDVRNNTALTVLYCGWSGLSTLDVHNNTALSLLDCHQTSIKSLDVSNNLQLTTLYCSSCDLSEIDVSKNTALIDLDCGDNNITTLDVSKNTSLQTLDCQATNISTLDVSNNRFLISLWCRLTDISILDTSNNPSLTDLNCCDNQYLSVLDLSQNPSITTLNCSNCKSLKTLDVRHNLALTKLECYHSVFNTLDVSNNAALEYLSCWDSSISKIYVGDHLPENCDYDDGVEIIYGSSGEHPISKSFKSADKSFTGDFGYCYSDSYFSHSAKKYDHSLATMSLCLAFSAYGAVSDSSYKNYDRNVKAVLEGCGFTGANYEKYRQYSFNAKPTNTSIGCAIGSKKLTDGTTIIAVAVRGGGYEAEWNSNLDVGHSGDHYGFNDAANQVCGYLTDYINEKEISGKIKIWITGFSRAGATATQAAAKLDRGEVQGISIDNTNVYAYGFATPMGAIKDNNPSDSIYDNIFSIIHYHDIVPLVAPEKWGFGRYGKTYIFPYKTSSKESNSYEKRMKAYLQNMGCKYEVDNFAPAYTESNDSMGLFMRKFVDSFAKNIGIGFPNGTTGRVVYRLGYQKDFQEAIGSGMLGKHHLELGLGLASLLSNEALDKRYTRLILKQSGFNPRLTATAAANCTLLPKAHADQRYYVAWMQSMDENYVVDAHRYLMSGNGRTIKIKCPVDVEVTDSAGNLVATIINEEPWQDEEASVIASIDENGQKTVYLPTDEDYSISVTAREDCSVTYTVEETAVSSLEPVRVTNYNIDDLSENEEIEATAGKYPEEEIEQAATEASSAEYTVLKDGQAVDPSLELNDPEAIEAHTYTVTTEFNEEEGTVYGAGHYIEGAAVLLTAENNPGYIFDGFYLNGNKLSDEDLDNDSSTVQLIVNDNADIQAKFTKCDHADMAQFVSKASFSKDGYIWKGCSECGYEEKTPIPAAAVKLSNKDFTYNKNTQKPSVTIKGLKEGTDYTVVNAGGRDIGRYKVAVTLKGDRYEGSQELTYNINPKGATISRPKAAKKAITAKWKAQKARMPKNRVTGYEVQISTKKDFSSGNKTYTVKGYKKTSRKITKLKSGKKYFVRVRTYMTVKGSGTFYSAWSKVKTVKVK